MICNSPPSTRQMKPVKEVKNQHSCFCSNSQNPRRLRRVGHSPWTFCHSPALTKSIYTPAISTTMPPTFKSHMDSHFNMIHGTCGDDLSGGALTPGCSRQPVMRHEVSQ